MEFLLTAVLWVIPFLLVLGLVVTVHELGHFLAAKSVGTKIDCFSIGFGRSIASWRDKQGVEWRLAWMPLGGYVRFAGDENMASLPDAEDLKVLRRQVVAREGEAEVRRYFHFKPLWQRAFIVAAGPAANFVLAIAIFAASLMALGEAVAPFRVGEVAPQSPAAAAGFKPGDVIVEAAGKKIRKADQVTEIVRVRAAVPTEFVVLRGEEKITLVATPRWQSVDDPVAGQQRVGMVGIAALRKPGDVMFLRYGPVEAVGRATVRTWEVLETSVYYLGRMVTGQVGTDQLRGPLGIASVAKNVATLGAGDDARMSDVVLLAAFNLIQLAALISISVGFMNLLPVPVLDGGHLMFYAYEAIARRPLAAKVQAAGYRVGLALVLGLMLFATWNDLQRHRVFNLFGGLFS